MGDSETSGREAELCELSEFMEKSDPVENVPSDGLVLDLVEKKSKFCQSGDEVAAAVSVYEGVSV